MSYWEILRIEPTKDASIIRKAYARQIKTVHPEDDPTGFQALREAYEWALANSKSRTVEEPDSGDIYTTQSDRSLHMTQMVDSEEWNGFESRNYEEEVDLISDFMGRVYKLYDNYRERIKVENWEALFEAETMWDLDCQIPLSDRMMAFIFENHRFPTEVWNTLNNNLHLSDRKLELYRRYPMEMLDYIFECIGQKHGMNYDFDVIPDDVDGYLNLRELSVSALEKGELARASEYIQSAWNLYDGDFELMIMKAELDLRNGNDDAALKFVSSTAASMPGHGRVKVGFARKLMKYYRVKEGIELCNSVLTHDENDTEALIVAASGYSILGNTNKAIELYRKANLLDLKNMEVKAELDVMAVKCREKLRIQPWNGRLRRELADIYQIIGEPSVERVRDEKRANQNWIRRVLFVVCYFAISVWILRNLQGGFFIVMGLIWLFQICKKRLAIFRFI